MSAYDPNEGEGDLGQGEPQEPEHPEQFGEAPAEAPEEQYEEPPPPAQGSSKLPWVVAVISIVLLLGVTVQFVRVSKDSATRVQQAELERDEIKGKADQQEKDRKTALAQAQDLTAKSQELTAKVATLTTEAKDKDDKLKALEDAHNAMVAKLKAALKGPKGKLPHSVAAALASGPAPSGAAAPKGKKKHH